MMDQDGQAESLPDRIGASPALAGAYAHCEALLRDGDKDRFLADLFIPAQTRPHAHALQAFSLEIARIRDMVSEPMPGELRQQWWRDALAGGARGEAAANPVAAALGDTLDRFGLASAPLEALIDARGFDLYDDPMPDMAALESYCRETSSVLFRLVADMLEAGASEASLTAAVRMDGARAGLGGSPPLVAEAADHAGLAYAFTGLIRAFALHAAQGRVYLPGDLLQRYGSSREEVLAGRATPALLAAIGEWRSQARRHLAAASAAIARLSQALRPAFLPLALVEPYLRRTERRDYDPFHTPVELPQWRRQWILWRGK
jgi:phytoene synthase